MEPASTPGADTAPAASAGGDGGANTPSETDAGRPEVTRPSRRAAILRSGLVVGILLLVFGVILPRFVDYGEVVAAFQALTPPQLLLMGAVVLVAWLVSGWMFVVLIPHLSIARGTEAYLILSGIGASVPMGPWNMAILWVVMRGWGVGIKPATSGIAVYGVLGTLTRLVTPALALVALALTGSRGDGGFALLITLLCTAVLVVAVSLMVAIVRSDQLADRVATLIGRLVAWVLARLHRPPPGDMHGAIRGFRDQLGEVIRRRGLAAMAVGTLGQLTWAIVLIVALRVVGIGSEVLSPGDILAVFALTSVITIIPIAPGGAGIPELLYIAGLTTIAGPSWEGAITAGVMLYRLFQWFVPIPLAWILLKVTRRGRSALPTTSELRAFTQETA